MNPFSTTWSYFCGPAPLHGWGIRKLDIIYLINIHNISCGMSISKMSCAERVNQTVFQLFVWTIVVSKYLGHTNVGVLQFLVNDRDAHSIPPFFSLEQNSVSVEDAQLPHSDITDTADKYRHRHMTRTSVINESCLCRYRFPFTSFAMTTRSIPQKIGHLIPP